MRYLPTFGCFLGQMLVNIPYMEHMGIQIIQDVSTVAVAYSQKNWRATQSAYVPAG
jgi:hypothetical protein